MAQNVTAPDLAQSSAHARPRRLEGRVCLITGAGGAIGLDTARVFLLEGAKVALVDINQSALDAAVTQLASLVPSSESTGSWVLPICADITVEATVEAYTKQTVDAFGRLDVVFLNAGLSYSSTPLFDTTEELFDRLMKVNVKSGKSPAHVLILALGVLQCACFGHHACPFADALQSSLGSRSPVGS